MPQQLYDRDRAQQQFGRRWDEISSKGELAFKVVLSFVALGVGAEIVVVASVILWTKLTKMTDAQLSEVILLDVIFVFVIAPLVGWALAGPIWRVVDRYFRNKLP